MISRRDVLQGAAALGAVGYVGRARAAGGQHMAGAMGQGDKADKVMTRYIGTPTSRVDGHAKVTGTAKYAGEFHTDGLVYGAVVDSTITKGRIVHIDAAEALRVAGVLGVVTHQNRPPMADTDEAHRDDVAPEGGSPFRPLYDDRILFNRQPIALVLAEDWETARFAASLVRVEYEKAAFNTDFAAARGRAYIVEKPERPRGDAAKAYQAAEIRHDAEYSVPRENHNPMELYAATTLWHGDGKITVYDKTQGVQNVQRYLCSALKLKPENVTVVAPYVGGAFGSGLRPQYECVLATLGALALKRSVRLVLTRAELYVLGYRPASIEHLALGANRGGMLESVTHEAIAVTSEFEAYSRNDTGWSALLYKSPNARYVHKLVALDLPTSCDMRAPGAATGVYGLECAMDELAVALKMDPLELRLITYSELDQNQNLPYTSKKLRECYQAGARAFGWDKRNPEPRSMRDGKTLVGWGMATGVWEALQLNHDIRIVLTANGHAEVSCATMDIGTGTYTIMAQVAAEMLGLPLEHVSVLLGDSTLPPAPVEGGSWGAASVANGIAAAAGLVRNDLLRLAQDMPRSPLAGMKPDDVVLTGGTIASRGDPSRAVAIGEAMRHGRVERIEHETNANFQEDKTHARNTHSAVFVEVKVDEQLGVVRVTRVVSAVAAGRILNTKTAHSQIMGSVVWGIGMALHEEALTDNRFGRVMNADIAEYHVPVNADIQKIDVIFVDEPDALINPLGVKGLGEIGIVGVAAAVANAVYHATGKRVRDLPITLDKLLA